jgi:hypothetical protein
MDEKREECASKLGAGQGAFNGPNMAVLLETTASVVN